MARARKKDPGPPPDETPVGRYIQGVLDGSVPACKWILRAVERHIRDLADGPSRGLRFDEKAAQRKIDFFGFLKHSKGEWAGTSFMLSPWQQFIIWVVYGWMQADGLRRFRTVYAELPRKNGKSTFAAGNALNLFMADGEPGAEVYCLAPETPILRSDLTWTPIAEVAVGDELLAFDEDPPGHGKQRKMRPARVLGKTARIAPTVRITTEGGRSVVCSPEHRWLTKAPSSINMRFREARALRPGHRMLILCDPWLIEASHEAGYLAGFLDGEGFLHAPRSAGAAFRVGFGQLPGLVLDKVMGALRSQGFDPKVPRKSDASGVMYSEVSGLAASLRLLGSFRPVRLLAKARDLWTDKKACFEADPIASIEEFPAQRLIDIETETGTFIARGFASHNCAATKRDQAKIVWGEAERMVKASPALLGRVTVLKGNLSIPGTASKLEPLGADEDTLDGLNPHASIIDELHAHKTRGVWDVLDTATGARRQPLQFAITTAGYDRHSICWEQHQYAEKVLDGIVEDDSFFAFIAALDEGDDWRDETTWAKANPNLGVSVKLDDLRRKAKKAQETPGYQNAFLRLHLNVWTEQAERWLDMARWDACAGKVDAQALAGRKCYGGLDLASTTDLAAFCLAFPPLKPGGRVDVLLWCWCPGEGIRLRSRRDKVPYDVWARQGFIAPTDGEVIDYEKIKGDIVRLGQIYKIEEIAFDRWGATQIRTQLEGDGFTMAEFGQGFVSMSAPSKELEKLVLGKRLGHGGNPVLRWMASNVSVRVDDAGNVKPSKAKSTGRIDGIVALIMSLARLSAHDGKQAKKSIYASRGMSFV